MRTLLVLPVSVNDIDEVAVALGRTGRQRQYLHSGLFFRDSNEQVLFLDLRIDGTITSGTPADKEATRYAWCIPLLHEALREQVAGLCEFIASRKQRVPYGFKHTPATFFAPDGTARIGQGSIGLTCATFVLAVFASLGQPLVRAETWPMPPQPIPAEDQEWQRSTLALLQRYQHSYGIPQTEIDRNEQDIPCARYSPSQAIGACRALAVPAHYVIVKQLGSECLKSLDAALSLVP